MRKIIQTLCSVFCVMSMNLPAEALAGQPGEVEDAMEDQGQALQNETGYSLTFAREQLDVEMSQSLVTDASGAMLMFLSAPDGRLVNDAQVVTTLIDERGGQLMQRARPFLGGYLVAPANLLPGRYRVEVEVVADGWLLTDETRFCKT